MAILKKVLIGVAIVWFITLFVCGFLAYSCTSHNATGSCDGFGRRLSEAPMIVRILFGSDRMWAGWKWFVGDMVVFWGSIRATTNSLPA
jgi:hypothetical protein